MFSFEHIQTAYFKTTWAQSFVFFFFFLKSTSFSGSEVIFPPWKTMVRKIDRFLFFLVGFSHWRSLRESQLFLPLCKKAIYYTVLYVLGKGGGGTLCTAEGAAAHLVMWNRVTATSVKLHVTNLGRFKHLFCGDSGQRLHSGPLKTGSLNAPHYVKNCFVEATERSTEKESDWSLNMGVDFLFLLILLLLFLFFFFVQSQNEIAN